MSSMYTDAEKRKILAKIEDVRKHSKLNIKEICKNCGISDASYYSWRKEFSDTNHCDDIPDETERLIVQMKTEYPHYGQLKLIKQLERFHGLTVKRSLLKKVLKKHGLLETAKSPRRKKGRRRFERLDPGDMVQMDIMYYVLKRNRRFYLISVLDDYSRFIMAHRVTIKQTADNVIDTLKDAVEFYGAPGQVLTDRGSQFHAWRGMSRFDKTLDKMGIEHVLASPQSPQTIGKIESFHRNIQRELLGQREFETIEDARDAISDYVEYYNHERVHMGIDYVTPADRFHRVADDVKKQMAAPQPVYLTARIDGQPLRAENSEDGKLVVKLAGKTIKEIEVSALKALLL